MDEACAERIEAKLDQIITTIDKCEVLITKVVAEVKPTLDSLMQTPLFKMLGGKRK